jgi:hypothetical protein
MTKTLASNERRKSAKRNPTKKGKRSAHTLAHLISRAHPRDPAIAVAVIVVLVLPSVLFLEMFSYPWPYPYPFNEEMIHLTAQHAKIDSWNVKADLFELLVGEGTRREITVFLSEIGMNETEAASLFIDSSPFPIQGSATFQTINGSTRGSEVSQFLVASETIVIVINKTAAESKAGLVVSYHVRSAFETGTAWSYPYGRMAYQLTLDSPNGIAPRSVILTAPRLWEIAIQPDSRIDEAYYQRLLRIFKFIPKSVPEHIVVEARRDVSPSIQLALSVLAILVLFDIGSKMYSWISNRKAKRVLLYLTIPIVLWYLFILSALLKYYH